MKCPLCDSKMIVDATKPKKYYTCTGCQIGAYDPFIRAFRRKLKAECHKSWNQGHQNAMEAVRQIYEGEADAKKWDVRGAVKRCSKSKEKPDARL